jgi:hypothetical protein
MQHGLASCEPIHGGLINVNPEFGHPAGGGWPDFIVWPRFMTLVHQQAYIDWLYRAYQGGLRLVSCLAVNNELLATKSNPRLPPDDLSAIHAQIAGMKAMAEFIDEQSGGPGSGWLQLAYSSEDARRIIGENKLAVVLDVEVDSLGNWRRVEDLEEACHGDIAEARVLMPIYDSRAVAAIGKVLASHIPKYQRTAGLLRRPTVYDPNYYWYAGRFLRLWELARETTPDLTIKMLDHALWEMG